MNQRHKGTLEMLLERQKKGSIFRISSDQVKSLSKGWEIPSLWPFGGKDMGPFNLLRNKPSVSNEYGRLYEVGPEDQGALENLNLMISFAHVTNGSMSAPMYNSRAIKIGIVTKGRGKFEMVTPHMWEGHRKKKKSSPIYRRVSSELRPGVVFVVPAGHPWVTMASTDSNLQILCFEVNARGNVKLAFAGIYYNRDNKNCDALCLSYDNGESGNGWMNNETGKRNIAKAMDREAKELAFNWPAEKVDAIFSRKEDFFFPGPRNLEGEEEEEEEEELPGRADA